MGVKLLSCAVIKADFLERISAARALLNAAHPNGINTSTSRDVRGLTIILLYAAYENLLQGVARAILEAAMKLKVGNKRLRPGLKLVASHTYIESMVSVSSTGVWKAGLKLIDTIDESRTCTLSSDVFPNDGSHFRRPQVRTFCKVFGLADPGPILLSVWQRIDSLVAERNAIAHGKMTAADVGRSYSFSDMIDLIDDWEVAWVRFIDWVELSASTRDFYRLPR